MPCVDLGTKGLPTLTLMIKAQDLRVSLEMWWPEDLLGRTLNAWESDVMSVFKIDLSLSLSLSHAFSAGIRGPPVTSDHPLYYEWLAMGSS